jgi:hypothetical protein
MKDAGPFPITWFADGLSLREIQPWFPLPSNLINNGQVWVPEIQGYAVVCQPIARSSPFSFLILKSTDSMFEYKSTFQINSLISD